MDFRHHTQKDSQAIAALFASVFTKSEGEAEGKLVGQLAKDLLEKTDEHDLYGFIAVDNAQVVGAILFSRLVFENGIASFILSPVAVNTDYQRKGIGQNLINHGLNELKNKGVSVVITYGDPRFYSKVGFRSISPEKIKAPFTLSQPEGWLGQSLFDNSIETLSGRCTLVEALSDAKYW